MREEALDYTQWTNGCAINENPKQERKHRPFATLKAHCMPHNQTKETDMKPTTTLAVVAAIAALSQPAAAQFAKPEDAIKYRQSAMFVMQQNFARLAGMVQGKLPYDAKLAADSAANAEYMSRLPWAGFVEGSDKGGNTKAKAEIWKDKAKFMDYAEKMQTEMSKLNATAKSGNLDALKPAVAAVGRSCKTCHDAFQE